MTNKLYVLFAFTALWLFFPRNAQAQALPVKTVDFKSEAVGRKLKYNIVLPTKYDQSTERFPVLYLLHGLTGNYTNWAGMGVPKYASKFNLIVVMPDGGNSWYVNWAKSDDGQKNDWEDCIIKDVIGHVDANFRTISKREGRAINGLSMGGFGGLMLGLRHADMFCSIGSHSGAIAIAKKAEERFKGAKETPKKAAKAPSTAIDPKIGVEGFSSQADRTPKGQMFTTAEQCAGLRPLPVGAEDPARQAAPHLP